MWGEHRMGGGQGRIIQTEIRKTIPFRLIPKETNDLGINLTKEVQDLFIENYKRSLKNIK